jgi:hypothetical protein
LGFVLGESEWLQRGGQWVQTGLRVGRGGEYADDSNTHTLTLPLCFRALSTFVTPGGGVFILPLTARENEA